MKFNHLILGLVAAALSLSACNKEQEQPAAAMTLKDASGQVVESVQFDASEKLSTTVSVTSNRDWKIADIPQWLSVSVGGRDVQDQIFPASDAPVSVSLTALPNDGMDRSAAIVFNGGTLAKKTLTVSQSGAAPLTTIEELRSMIGSAESITIPPATVIKGVIISDASLSNLTSKKSAYIQDATGGINLYCAADHSLSFGDEVSIDVSGANLKVYAVSLEVEGLALDRITTLSKGNAVEPRSVTVDEFLSNDYESQYIALENVQVAEADLAKTWVIGGNHTSINMVSKDGKAFVVRSSKYSTFGKETVAQGSGTLKGIATIYNDGMQIVFAQASDWAGLTGERFTIETPKIESEKISVIKEASQGAEVVLRNATVVATALTDQESRDDVKMNFLLTDSGRQDYLFVYSADVSGLKIGDNVTVQGTLSSYAGTPQISGATVTTNGSGSYEHPVPTDITDNFDNFESKGNDYISFKGTYNPSADGKYLNIDVLGATDKTGSILVPDTISLDEFKNVPNTVFTGYYLYTASGKYIWMILTDVKKSQEPYLAVSPSEITVSASETSATFSISSNVSWTCESLSEGFTLDKGSGEGDATVTVSFSENKDTQNARVATIKVSSAAADKTVTITQSKFIDVSGSKYVLVTSDLTDWSGRYLIVWEGEAHAVIVGKDLASSATIEDNGGVVAYAPELESATVVIEKVDGGYTVLLPSGKYLSCNADSNQCAEVNKPYVFDSITVKEGISGKDTKPQSRYLLKNGSYYRFYKSIGTYVVPSLYRLEN